MTRKLLPKDTILLFTRGLEIGLAVTYLVYVAATVQTTNFAWFFCPCAGICYEEVGGSTDISCWKTNSCFPSPGHLHKEAMLQC